MRSGVSSPKTSTDRAIAAQYGGRIVSEKPLTTMNTATARCPYTSQPVPVGPMLRGYDG